jgi:hypothetical protein
MKNTTYTIPYTVFALYSRSDLTGIHQVQTKNLHSITSCLQCYRQKQ